MEEKIITYDGKTDNLAYEICMADGEIKEIRVQAEYEGDWFTLDFDDLNAAISKAYIR
jgi:hypothetical protein